MEILFTAFLFGLLAGLLPGPILTAGFMTIIKNPNGFQKVLPFPVIAGVVEIGIGIVMVRFGASFFTDAILLSVTILGIINIYFITYKILKNRKNFTLFSENSKNSYSAISYKEVFLLTALNGPLYLFWITVCIPMAITAEKTIENGGVLFVLTMVLGVALMTLLLFYFMHISRKSFQNETIMKIIPFVISLFFIFIGFKMMHTASTLI